MGDLRSGDAVLGCDGKPCRVVHAMPVQHGRPCYRVRFSDGSSIVADERHEWLTETLRARESTAKAARRDPTTKPRGTDQRYNRRHFPAVVETGQIRDTLWARDGFALNHSIATCEPLELPDVALPIDPYTLGAWLGDGSSSGAQITIHPDDHEILDRIRAAGYTVTKHKPQYLWGISRKEAKDAAKARAAGLVASGVSIRASLRMVGIDRRSAGMVPIRSLVEELRDLGVLGNKHIPAEYLRASHAQRLALVQGLLDTDGSVGKSGHVEFCSVSRDLAEGFLEAVLSLGVKATVRASDAVLNGRTVGTRYRVTFATDLPVFHLSRKRARLGSVSRRAKLRYITAVEPVESVPVRCIEVDSPDHLFLAGRAFIPTHNSVWMRQIGVTIACGLHPFNLRPIPPRRVLIVDCENPKRIMADKLATLRGVARVRGADAADRLWIKRFPQGLDLSSPNDRLALHMLCQMLSPDVLLIGPVYKLYVGGANSREEDLARLVTAELDRLREEFGFALVLEHHSPHAAPGVKQRSVRPIGSSLWLRWPEFGLGLRPAEGTEIPDRVADVVSWRGARDERAWPRRLEAGREGEMPWVDPNQLRRSA